MFFFIPIFSVVFIMDQEQNVKGQQGVDTVRRSPRVQNKRKQLDKNELKERRKRLRLKVPLSPIQDEESDDEQDLEFAPAGDGSGDDNVVIVGGDENTASAASSVRVSCRSRPPPVRPRR